MTKCTTTSTLSHLAVVLATGVALMATAGMASAKGHHDHINNGNGDSHFSNSMHAGAKAERKARKKEAKCKKKACDEPTQTASNGASAQSTNRTATPTGTQTGTAAPGFVVSGQATNVKQTTTTANVNAAPVAARPGFVISGQSTDQKAVNFGNGTATISNGKTTSAIGNGKTLTVTSTSSGTFTVSNGTNSVTLNGAALQLANAPSIQAGSNVESYRQKDGSVIFLAKATPVTPPGGTNKTPPGVTLADDAAFVGKGFAAPIVIAGLDAGALVAGTGAVVVGTLSGHFGDIPDMLHDVGDVTVRGYDWVSSWF